MQEASTESLEDRKHHWREQARQAESQAEQAERRTEYGLAAFWWAIAQGFDQTLEALDTIEDAFGPLTLTDQHGEEE